MGQLVFSIVAMSGVCYFLLRRRRFDLFTIGFFASVIYFMPGFFGYTTYHTQGSWTEHDIEPLVYLVMVCVLTIQWLFAYANDLTSSNFCPAKDLFFTKHVPFALALFAMASFAALVMTAGSSIHEADKNAVAENLGRWHILLYTSATLGICVSYVQRKFLYFGCFFAFLVFDLYLGYRSAVAMATISVLYMYLSSKGPRRLLVDDFPLILLFAALGFFLFGYKVIAFAVKAGMWDLVFEHIGDPETYKLMFLRSEPFVIQQILNEVVRVDLSIDFISVLGAANQLILFSPELGLEMPSFNSQFQPYLFPDVEYGMAANIWAQMWAAGGLVLVVLFAAFFNTILFLVGRILQSGRPTFNALLVPGLIYWAFYTHRNDLGYAINIEKRLLLVSLASLLVAYSLKAKPIRSGVHP
jgi:hypothetical protein